MFKPQITYDTHSLRLNFERHQQQYPEVLKRVREDYGTTAQEIFYHAQQKILAIYSPKSPILADLNSSNSQKKYLATEFVVQALGKFMAEVRYFMPPFSQARQEILYSEFLESYNIKTSVEAIEKLYKIFVFEEPFFNGKPSKGIGVLEQISPITDIEASPYLEKVLACLLGIIPRMQQPENDIKDEPMLALTYKEVEETKEEEKTIIKEIKEEQIAPSVTLPEEPLIFPTLKKEAEGQLTKVKLVSFVIITAFTLIGISLSLKAYFSSQDSKATTPYVKYYIIASTCLAAAVCYSSIFISAISATGLAIAACCSKFTNSSSLNEPQSSPLVPEQATRENETQPDKSTAVPTLSSPAAASTSAAESAQGKNGGDKKLKPTIAQLSANKTPVVSTIPNASSPSAIPNEVPQSKSFFAKGKSLLIAGKNLVSTPSNWFKKEQKPTVVPLDEYYLEIPPYVSRKEVEKHRAEGYINYYSGGEIGTYLEARQAFEELDLFLKGTHPRLYEVLPDATSRNLINALTKSFINHHYQLMVDYPGVLVERYAIKKTEGLNLVIPPPYVQSVKAQLAAEEKANGQAL